MRTITLSSEEIDILSLMLKDRWNEIVTRVEMNEKPTGQEQLESIHSLLNKLNPDAVYSEPTLRDPTQGAENV